MNKEKIKASVNLPKTDFPIRAELNLKEPKILDYWQEIKLDKKITEQQLCLKKSFTLHDGPPYPNGPIHMGHALNKILKDIVVRSKRMQGLKSEFIPGWDCHGLPIEMQVIKSKTSLSKETINNNIYDFRNQCKEFALDYVEEQKQEFIRLGITGTWDTPYLTLNPEYEAKVIEAFGKIAENDLIYEGKKPIHWCPNCETALAEAEIEYQDHRSPSIFVKFKVVEASKKLKSLVNPENLSLLVWTTTPWTLPSNTAVAAHPDFTYVIAKNNEEKYLFLADLKDALITKLELTNYQEIAEIKGKDLIGTITKHPFIDRESPVVLADYVTAEDGTGFVHIAPGHGQEDYQVGLRHNLPIIMPVDNEGKFTEEVPNLKGVGIFDANKIICEQMNELQVLIKLEFIKHAYPHCWRCKKPVIFRAVEQWFIAVDKPFNGDLTLREKALAKIKEVTWYPSWGENRITGMISNRPDWCISRQRFWGIPLPIFICEKCGNPEMKGEFNLAVKNMVAKEGSMAWFMKSASEILPKSLKCSKCGQNEFRKDQNILDVWFESGSSFHAVLSDHLGIPAQLYLEGSDQHRGWFQSSLLIGLASSNQTPFEAVLTHGFLTDDHGKKMSKSEGNVISPNEVIKTMGADVLRFWAASSDFKNSDISITGNIVKQAQDNFSKIRNTLRFLLSNLFDFNPEKDLITYQNLNEIDQWILHKLFELNEFVVNAYNEFDFHLITHRIHDFAAVTLSSLYLDMVKDRLYCDAADSSNRKSTQTAIYYLLEILIKLIAPILAFTSEEAYGYFNNPNKLNSIHLENFSALSKEFNNPNLAEKWEKILKIKNLVYAKLEALRNEKIIKSFLEAEIALTLNEKIDFNEWESVLIVSKVNINQGPELIIEVNKIEQQKCDRCWKYLETKDNLCERCLAVIETLAKK